MKQPKYKIKTVKEEWHFDDYSLMKHCWLNQLNRYERRKATVIVDGVEDDLLKAALSFGINMVEE